MMATTTCIIKLLALLIAVALVILLEVAWETEPPALPTGLPKLYDPPPPSIPNPYTATKPTTTTTKPTTTTTKPTTTTTKPTTTTTKPTTTTTKPTTTTTTPTTTTTKPTTTTTTPTTTTTKPTTTTTKPTTTTTKPTTTTTTTKRTTTTTKPTTTTTKPTTTTTKRTTTTKKRTPRPTTRPTTKPARRRRTTRMAGNMRRILIENTERSRRDYAVGGIKMAAQPTWPPPPPPAVAAKQRAAEAAVRPRVGLPLEPGFPRHASYFAVKQDVDAVRHEHDYFALIRGVDYVTYVMLHVSVYAHIAVLVSLLITQVMTDTHPPLESFLMLSGAALHFVASGLMIVSLLQDQLSSLKYFLTIVVIVLLLVATLLLAADSFLCCNRKTKKPKRNKRRKSRK